MQIWLDTVNLRLIRDASMHGFISGVTTNPSILSTAQHDDVRETLDNLLSLQSGPVAIQVTQKGSAGILEEAKSIYSYSQRAIIKVFADKEGLAAIPELHKASIPVLATGVLQPMQALLAANLGAAYIAPYFSHIGEPQVAQKTLSTIVSIFHARGYKTKILVASLKSLSEIIYCAELGVDAVTIKDSLYEQLFSDHQLLATFSKKFSSAWCNRYGDTSFTDLLNPASVVS